MGKRLTAFVFEPRYYTRAYAGISTMMAAYPHWAPISNGVQLQKARMLLPLAWLVRAPGWRPTQCVWLESWGGFMCFDDCSVLKCACLESFTRLQEPPHDPGVLENRSAFVHPVDICLRFLHVARSAISESNLTRARRWPHA